MDSVWKIVSRVVRIHYMFFVFVMVVSVVVGIVVGFTMFLSLNLLGEVGKQLFLYVASLIVLGFTVIEVEKARNRYRMLRFIYMSSRPEELYDLIADLHFLIEIVEAYASGELEEVFEEAFQEDGEDREMYDE